MNHSATSTSEATLHQILQAIIIDGLQRARPEADIKANAEAAARVLRAGLAAFTAAPEAVTGGANAKLDVTRHCGGAAGYSFGQVGAASPAMADPLAGLHAHLAAAAKVSARSCSALAAFAALNRLADAAGKLPPSAPDAVGAAK